MPCNNQCQKYKAERPRSGSRYRNGQKRCQVCDIYLNWDGLHCPCCNYRLRSKPRNIKFKQRLQEIRTDSTIKTIFVGSGKNPKLKLEIDPVYLNAVPRLFHDQFESLKESIAQDGLHEPITVNQDGKILDGHTRYQICSMLDKPVQYVVKRFKTLDDERKYVITSNLKRRQLNHFQQFELVEALRNKMIFERSSEKSNKIWAVRKGEKEPEYDRTKSHYAESTDYKISKMTGLGVGQIEACVYVKAHGTPELIEKVRTGEITTNRAKVLLLQRDDESYLQHPERRIDQAPSCEECGAPCRKKRKCHVHDEWCYTKCKWGK